MPRIELKYGDAHFPLDYDENHFTVLGGAQAASPPLSDVEIGAAFDEPIDSKSLEEIVQPNETVLFVVPDATRASAAGQIVNLLVRRLIANGTLPGAIACIFATGIHRAVTEAEKRQILTAFIVQRLKILNHDAKDLGALVRIGETASGISVEVNRAVREYDHVVIVGSVTFHYFAGFSGGRKLICPGLAASRTISQTHRLAFDCERKTRRAGVDAGLLEGNAVHEALMEIVGRINPAFSVNTIVNERGEAVKVFAGDWRTAHLAACDYYAREYTIQIAEKRSVVIVSAGGAPFDSNMIQAHKALDAAARACTPGGKIYLLAECADGLGRHDFAQWFEAENSVALAEKLCAKYQVNGQTAWSLLKKAETFETHVLTALAENQTRLMRLQKIDSARKIQRVLNEETSGYILPFGAKFHIRGGDEE